MTKRRLRSNFEPGSPRWAVRRAQWRALGLTEADLEKPKIAVVNTSSELSTCFNHLDGVAARVKEAIRAAGALAFEVRTAAPSDFITSAGRQGRYILPSRDLLVNDIEVQVEGALLDGMVCLASCDKTAPGQLMAAARLDIPSIIVPCGYQPHGHLDGHAVDIEEVYESVGKVGAGQITLERLGQMCDVAIGGPGVCAGMGTANTMHIASEALGMALPGSTPVLANSARMFAFAQAAGRRIVGMVEEDLRPRRILTPQAFENAVMAGLALSASINLVRHLQAIAMEAGCPVDIYELYDRLGPRVPLLCAVRPNGDTRIEELEAAGGTRAVLKRLEALVHRDALTVSGRSWGEELAQAGEVGAVLRTVDDPISRKPSVIVMRGNLAPEGSILKLGDASAKETLFRGKARVFGSQDEALKALHEGRLVPGTVAVLHGMGCRGGPGMALASGFVAAVDGAGLSTTVAVITDGQLSGLNRGIAIGQVSPEAAMGGAIGLVNDGDAIVIDTEQHTVTLEVAQAELEARRECRTPRLPAPEKGWLSIYERVVEPMSKGAVLVGPRKDRDRERRVARANDRRAWARASRARRARGAGGRRRPGGYRGRLRRGARRGADGAPRVLWLSRRHAHAGDAGRFLRHPCRHRRRASRARRGRALSRSRGAPRGLRRDPRPAAPWPHRRRALRFRVAQARCRRNGGRPRRTRDAAHHGGGGDDRGPARAGGHRGEQGGAGGAPAARGGRLFRRRRRGRPRGAGSTWVTKARRSRAPRCSGSAASTRAAPASSRGPRFAPASSGP